MAYPRDQSSKLTCCCLGRSAANYHHLGSRSSHLKYERFCPKGRIGSDVPSTKTPFASPHYPSESFTLFCLLDRSVADQPTHSLLVSVLSESVSTRRILSLPWDRSGQIRTGQGQGAPLSHPQLDMLAPSRTIAEPLWSLYHHENDRCLCCPRLASSLAASSVT